MQPKRLHLLSELAEAVRSKPRRRAGVKVAAVGFRRDPCAVDAIEMNWSALHLELPVGTECEHLRRLLRLGRPINEDRGHPCRLTGCISGERDIVASATEEAAIVLVSARKGELSLRGVQAQRKTLRKES